MDAVRAAVGLTNLQGSPQPTVYALAGVPGAGKSTFVQNAIHDGVLPAHHFLLNPDVVMNAMPGYLDALGSKGPEDAFREWEMPARELAYALLEEAIVLRADIVKDMACARVENFEQLSRLKSLGYRLEMYHIQVTPETALSRLHRRELETGRHTPAELVWERHQSLAELTPSYRLLVDVYRAFDNNDLDRPFRPLD